jgi:hypothetical protein
MAKKTASAKLGELHESLVKEMKALIPKLDSEGLAFLVKQARVLIYNMQVDQLNKAAQAAHTASNRSKAVKALKTQAQKKDKIEIKATDSGSGFYLYYNNGNTVFSKSEMTSLVKIAHADADESEICERLFRWIERERKDVFLLVPIYDKYDEKLKILADLIRKKFKLK